MQLYDRAAEMQVMKKLAEIRDVPIGWQAIHFHLSHLMEEYKNEYQSKIAINLMHDLLKKYEGGIYLLENNDMLVICYKLEKTIQNKLIFQIRYLYMDDPLAYSGNGQENQELCTVYELKHSWKAFYEMYTKYMSTARRSVNSLGRPVKSSIDPDSAPLKLNEGADANPENKVLAAPSETPRAPAISKMPNKPAEAAKALSAQPKGIESVVEELRNVDLSSVIRKQPVCAVLSNMTIRRVFDEVYTLIPQLRSSVKIESDYFSNRWLFKYVTCVLDQRVLQLLREKPEQHLKDPISININAETLLSSWFTEFDAAINPMARISIVFEVPVVDAFADMAAFNLARQEVQKLGYRVCLDGLTTASFHNISREQLGVDLVKVQWNADVQSDLNSQENKELADAVRAAGSNRVILCRCDNRSAIEFGHALGISLFQGRYIDSLLDPTSKVNN
jgi:EAL domain-containing protein (putative c-di-GMP-specific phosphodiesterase class I)